jgi:hypothetical protein
VYLHKEAKATSEGVKEEAKTKQALPLIKMPKQVPVLLTGNFQVLLENIVDIV